MKILLASFALFFSSLFAQENTRFSLISETDTFVPGETVWLGLRFEIQPEWHIYWINPGDSGMPPEFTWKLPEGFSIGDLQWPVPMRLVSSGLVTLGYDGDTVVLVPLTTPQDLAPGTTVTLNVDSSWLECKELCVPASGSASLQLTAVATPSGIKNAAFASYRSALPEGSPLLATRRKNELSFQLPDRSWQPPFSYFPLEEGAWQLEPPPHVVAEAGALRIRLVRNESSDEPPATLRGLLVDASGRGIHIETGNPISPVQPVDVAASPNIVWLLVLALFAGVMLNLMPCIFPVLGLKISSFVEQSKGDPKAMRIHAWVFAAGILVSLWILGAAVSALGSVWGAQFQDPRVVIALLLVLTLFTMNLFGVFEMGHAMTRVGGDLTQKQGYSGSFFQGVLLTVIGTPCTGPVMAAVIGPLLTQPPAIVFLAFSVMGLGLAAPYVLLAYLPKLLDKLPPPGMWMVTFKQGSAFMMVLFLWGMLYVLKGLEPLALLPVLGALMLVCFAAWVLGTWGAPERKDRVRLVAKIMALLILLMATGLAYSYSKPLASADDALRTRIAAGEPLRWSDVSPELAEQLLAEGVPVHYRPFSPELLAELRAAGTPVFVDFTADWCTQCKINKITTLYRENVMRAFTQAGVVTLRADLTKRDDALTALLASHGRRGLPVYMLFTGKGGEDLRFLSEKLSPEIIFEALDALGK